MSRDTRHAAPASKVKGVLTSTPIDGGVATQMDLIQCCHCQFSKVYRPGDERRWAVCWRCADWHCPRPGCEKCVPVKQWLENLAAGRPADHRPVIVSPGHELPGGG